MSSSGEIPQYNDFRTMQKQTGGRLISLTSGDLDVALLCMFPKVYLQTVFFVESINKNNLVLDAGYQVIWTLISNRHSIIGLRCRNEDPIPS